MPKSKLQRKNTTDISSKETKNPSPELTVTTGFNMKGFAGMLIGN